MPRERERGAGRISSFLWLLAFVSIGWAAWKIAPVYFANYALKDRMVEVARMPKSTPLQQMRDILNREVQEQELTAYVKGFNILLLETARKISCEYEREVEVLPGFRRKFSFQNEVEQPVLF